MKFRLKLERVVRGTKCFKLQVKVFPFIWIDCKDGVCGEAFVPDFVTPQEITKFATHYAKIRGKTVKSINMSLLKTNRMKHV